MLTSQLGIRLALLLGKTVPLPAPYELVRALTRVEVTNDARSGDGFQLSFALSKSQPADYSLIQGGLLDPDTRVIIAVILGALPEVLIDGIITHQQHAPNNDPGQSTFTVTGKDVSLALDLEERNEKYDNQPDFLIVTQLIAKYAKYGLIPEVTPTTDVPIMIDRIPRQSHETDLQFIKRMARRNGYVFYVEPVTIGVNTAYWGPVSRVGLPQPALTLGQSPSANLKSLHFAQDALAAVATTGTFVEPITKVAIPIPALPSLRIPPLALSPTPALRTVVTSDTANRNPVQAATAALASTTNAPDPVTGGGEIDTVRYGNVLRARKLVGIRGAGFSYDGNYYVSRVTHTVTPGDYRQSFQVSREGTGALLPVVRP
jgi:hypothetical protein